MQTNLPPGARLADEVSIDDTGGFDDVIIRHNFIRKVYSILMVQMLITMGIMAFFMFYHPATIWVDQHPWVYIVVIVLLFIFMLLLVCCERIRRKYPLNIIFLGIFTVLQGACLGVISAHFRINQVLMAFGITCIIVFALTIFAFQTKWDFTVLGTGLMIVTLVFLIFGIVLIFVKMKILHLIYSCLGALLFSFYLVFDTQLLMGGKHKYSISPEEYIVAVLCLYLDIINLFLMILKIIGMGEA